MNREVATATVKVLQLKSNLEMGSPFSIEWLERTILVLADEVAHLAEQVEKERAKAEARLEFTPMAKTVIANGVTSIASAHADAVRTLHASWTDPATEFVREKREQ